MTQKTLEKACTACAKAKRRCGKQKPHCRRCIQRGYDCTYPITRPTCSGLSRSHDIAPVELTPSGTTVQEPAYHLNSVDGGATPAGHLSSPISSVLLNSLVDERLASSWFAAQETWDICFPPAADAILSVTNMKRFMSKVHRWLRQWVAHGSNPFIHTRLYRDRMPQCIQDTYATLACYFQKTSSNEQIVFQIIESRVKHLLAEHGISTSTVYKDPSSKAIDSLEHLARVQSLLIYQIIGLYDGDIRLRYLSESYSPILQHWMQEMVVTVSQVSDLGDSIISSKGEQEGGKSKSVYSTHADNLLWYAWILAESVRRTWIVGSSILVIFSVLQQKFVPPCQGGMMVTTRKGVWEAQSAQAWEEICSEVHVGLMQMAETDRLFTEVGPEEVNEFTKVVLCVVFGPERMERWGDQVED